MKSPWYFATQRRNTGSALRSITCLKINRPVNICGTPTGFYRISSSKRDEISSRLWPFRHKSDVYSDCYVMLVKNHPDTSDKYEPYSGPENGKEVILFGDTFNTYFESENLYDAREILSA